MIVDNRDVSRPRFGPPKHDSPLVVDANGMKPAKIAMKRFQSIAGRNGKVRQLIGSIHLHQLAKGNTSDRREALVPLLDKQLPCICVGE